MTSGAIRINRIFGIVLSGWLLRSGDAVSSRGSFVSWTLAGILVGISIAELVSLPRSVSARSTCR